MTPTLTLTLTLILTLALALTLTLTLTLTLPIWRWRKRRAEAARATALEAARAEARAEAARAMAVAVAVARVAAVDGRQACRRLCCRGCMTSQSSSTPLAAAGVGVCMWACASMCMHVHACACMWLRTSSAIFINCLTHLRYSLTYLHTHSHRGCTSTATTDVWNAAELWNVHMAPQFGATCALRTVARRVAATLPTLRRLFIEWYEEDDLDAGG